ncbi:hypothetical protein R6Z07F_017900 [Ovis aries]
MVRVLAVEDVWVLAKRSEENKARNSERGAARSGGAWQPSQLMHSLCASPALPGPTLGARGRPRPGGIARLQPSWRRFAPRRPPPIRDASARPYSGPTCLELSEKLARKRLFSPVKRAPSRCGGSRPPAPREPEAAALPGPVVPEFLPWDPLTSRCEYGLLAPPPRPRAVQGEQVQMEQGPPAGS